MSGSAERVLNGAPDAPVPHTDTHALLSTDSDVRLAHARDVSGLHLLPDAVARPTSVAEVADVLAHAHAMRTPVTPAGLQSSTTGASITDHGVLLSLAAMAQVLDLDPVQRFVRVQAGARVADVRRVAESAGLLFTPDPTSEEESTVGGAIACNASGARSFLYGATRPHVRALTVLLANGEQHELRRPQLEKNTVGYPIVHDPVDWFVGSEGTLGVVVEAELSLVPLPAQVTGLAIPFASESDALAFIVAAREASGVRASGARRSGASISGADANALVVASAIAPRCLEFFDSRAVAVVRAHDERAGWGTDVAAIVYTENVGDDARDLDLALDAWLTLAEAHHALTGDIRVYDGDAALADARRLRHAVPSTMNERGATYRAQGGRKVSTDWAVPYRQLASTLEMAHRLADAAGIERSVTYGHAGNGHPHQNFIARDADELARLEVVLRDTLTRVVALGGTVAAEHGIGKIKRKWLPLQLSPLQQQVMVQLKQALDPHGLMAPGNVL